VPSVAPVGFDIPGLHEGMPETKAISFGDDGASFFENLLDIINPLQHIPIVSTIYRAITGDEIAAPARLIGGALFGGPVGFASSAANLIFEEASGDDLAGHALALISEPGATPELANALAPTAVVTAPAFDLASPASQAAPRAAIAVVASDNGAAIIWNGPRVLPSLARSAKATQGGASSDTAINAPSTVGVQNSEIVPVETAVPQAEPGKPSAVGLSPAARPAWLDAAITDAQSVQNSAQLGKAPQKVTGQPWVTDAMLEALGKYQALQLERNR
jgi:hypothetical protein